MELNPIIKKIINGKDLDQNDIEKFWHDAPQFTLLEKVILYNAIGSLNFHKNTNFEKNINKLFNYDGDVEKLSFERAMVFSAINSSPTAFNCILNNYPTLKNEEFFRDNIYVADYLRAYPDVNLERAKLLYSKYTAMSNDDILGLIGPVDLNAEGEKELIKRTRDLLTNKATCILLSNFDEAMITDEKISLFIQNEIAYTMISKQISDESGVSIYPDFDATDYIDSFTDLISISNTEFAALNSPDTQLLDRAKLFNKYRYKLPVNLAESIEDQLHPDILDYISHEYHGDHVKLIEEIEKREERAIILNYDALAVDIIRTIDFSDKFYEELRENIAKGTESFLNYTPAPPLAAITLESLGNDLKSENFNNQKFNIRLK